MTFHCELLRHAVCVTASGGISPCCATRKNTELLTQESNILNKIHNPLWSEMITAGDAGIAHENCMSCVKKEEMGAASRRTKLNPHVSKIKTTHGIPDNSCEILAMDISISNTCNQKCIMCSSQFSSAWLQADLANKKNPIYAKARGNIRYENWSLTYEQIDQIVSLITPNTALIEIKGGEPLYDKKFDYLVREACLKNSNIKVMIATNGSHFTDHTLELLNSIKHLTVCVSIDAINDKYPMIRVFNFNKFQKSFETAVSNLNRQHTIIVNPTVMKYNLTEIRTLYEWVGNISKKYNREINLNFAQVVTNVQCMSASYGTKDEIYQSIDQFNYIRNDPLGFCNWSGYTTRIDSIIAFLTSSLTAEVLPSRNAEEQSLLAARGMG